MNDVTWIAMFLACSGATAVLVAACGKLMPRAARADERPTEKHS